MDLPLEVLVRILDFLPGRCLKSCRCVCKNWKEATEIVFSKKIRQTLDAVSFIGEIKSVNLTSAAITDYLQHTSLDIDTVVFLTQTSKNAQVDKKVCQYLNELSNSAFQSKPIEEPFTKMIGSVVKFSFGPRMGNLKDLVDTLEASSTTSHITSVLLFPKMKSYHIDTFHIPLKKKYEMIKGYAGFLPEIHSRASFVLLFIHPISLGRMAHFVKVLHKLYGPGTCIVGLYSESCLFTQHVITSNEIIGMVLSGDVICFSMVVNDDIDTENMKLHVKDFCKQVKKSADMKAYVALVFIFACNSVGNWKTLSILAQLRSEFHDGLIFGAYAPSIFGADYNVSDKFRLPGGRDFLQTKGVVLSASLIRRDSAFP